MNKHSIYLALISVFMISIGQLLFKKTGLEIKQSGELFNFRVFFFLGIALFVYMLATLLWISVLRTVPLAKVYIIMSLSFVLVPLGSFFVFQEKISFIYILGSFFIIIGVLIVSKYN